MQLQPGQILADKYRIVRMIGHGGMGAVFEGENTRIRRRVAIYVMPVLDLPGAARGEGDLAARLDRIERKIDGLGGDA